jgi:hypothetical protein
MEDQLYRVGFAAFVCRKIIAAIGPLPRRQRVRESENISGL